MISSRSGCKAHSRIAALKKQTDAGRFPRAQRAGDRRPCKEKTRLAQWPLSWPSRLKTGAHVFVFEESTAQLRRFPRLPQTPWLGPPVERLE